MDFSMVLQSLLDGFERLKIRYAVVGGFALGALGAARATKDIDFLVHRDDLEALDGLLAGLGYRRIHHSENVSQYQHGSEGWGGLDFLHAFRAPGLRILERALVKPVFHGARSIRVARPEDLIGLKLQATVLSESEKKQMREEALSQSLRRDFDALRRNSRPVDPRNLDLDDYLAFLDGFARLFQALPRPHAIQGATFKI